MLFQPKETDGNPLKLYRIPWKTCARIATRVVFVVVVVVVGGVSIHFF